MSSLNFLDFLPEEISESIFMKLSSSDVLKAMLVHSSWNEFISSSRKLMNGVKLRLNSKTIKPNSPENVIASLNESTRMFEHLELNIFGATNACLIDIIELRDWKSFELRGKILQVDACRLMEKLKETCSNLVSLDLQTDWLEETNKVLRSCKNLKQLRLRGCFENDKIIEHLEMKLEKLELKTWRDYNRTPSENPQGFNNFLRSQADTLKSLSIDFGSYGPYVDQTTLLLILEMPKLTDLKLNIESEFLPFHQSLEHLPENFSISKLHLLLNFHNILKWGLDKPTKSFMKKFRGLKTLQLKELHRKVFEFISDFETLEEIVIDELIYISSDNSGSAAFPNLQRINFGHAIHPELQRHIENAAVDELGNFSRNLLIELRGHPNNENTFRSTAIYPTCVLESAWIT